MRQIAPRSVLYRCDRKPLAETIVHFNGAVYTSLIDLTLYLLYEVRGGFFVLLDPPAKIQLKQVVSHQTGDEARQKKSAIKLAASKNIRIRMFRFFLEKIRLSIK